MLACFSSPAFVCVLRICFRGPLLCRFTFYLQFSYRKDRILAFSDPYLSDRDSASHYSVADRLDRRRDWTGLMERESRKIVFYLPERIRILFCRHAEELGLVGALAVIILFCDLLGAGRAARRCYGG